MHSDSKLFNACQVLCQLNGGRLSNDNIFVKTKDSQGFFFLGNESMNVKVQV